MDLHVSLQGRRNLTGQIYQQVRAAILDGLLPAGAALPPSRELAARLQVARHTVGVAYDRLMAEGLVSGRAGAGTYVSTQFQPATDSVRRAPSGPPTRPREVWNSWPAPTGLSPSSEFDFRPGVPDWRLFPYPAWRRLLVAQLGPANPQLGVPGDPAGHPATRAAIARYIGLSRAVQAGAEDVLVTNGAQHAVDLVARVLLEPGDVVAVEDPGYHAPAMLFHSHGARVVGVPVDAEGLVVDRLPDLARLVYVTPSHQFPLGMPMSLARRLALVRWADRHGAVVLEDDYDTEFRYTGRPVDPLQTLDRAGRVAYIGSFSKTMLPSLRLGFLIAPPTLRDALVQARYLTDWHTSLPDQLALADFIDSGLLARHARRMRTVYRQRHEIIRDALAGPLQPWLEGIPAEAGLHIAAYSRIADAARLRQAVELARRAGLDLYDLAGLTGSPRPGLVLGYGALPTEKVAPGLDIIRRSMTTVFGRP